MLASLQKAFCFLIGSCFKMIFFVDFLFYITRKNEFCVENFDLIQPRSISDSTGFYLYRLLCFYCESNAKGINKASALTIILALISPLGEIPGFYFTFKCKQSFKLKFVTLQTCFVQKFLLWLIGFYAEIVHVLVTLEVINIWTFL